MFITYYENGQLKGGEVNQMMYEQISKRPSVSSLTIHPNQISMLNSLRENKGLQSDKRRILFG